MKTGVKLAQTAKKAPSAKHPKSERAAPTSVFAIEPATSDLQVEQAMFSDTAWGAMTSNLKEAASDGILQGHNGLVVQRKMTLGEVGDKYEQEADRLTPQIVRQINSPGFGKQFGKTEAEVEGTIPATQLKALRPTLQLKGDSLGNSVSPEIESAIHSAKGAGQPLESGVQQQFGQAMGIDFKGVRVHTNALANQLNRALNSRAFTTRQDLFFKQGEYQPESQGGQELLAHELTHVAQQTFNGKLPGIEKLGKTTHSRIVQRLVVNLGVSEDEQPVDELAKNASKRDFQRDTFVLNVKSATEASELLEIESKEIDSKEIEDYSYHRVVEKKEADFSTFEDSDEPIILVAHGGGGERNFGEYATHFGGRDEDAFFNKDNGLTPKALGKWLKNRGLPKTYHGMIYVNGCYTAVGPEIGVEKAYIDKLTDYLQKEGYEYVSVKGNLGRTKTDKSGTEKVKPEFIVKAAAELSASAGGMLEIGYLQMRKRLEEPDVTANERKYITERLPTGKLDNPLTQKERDLVEEYEKLPDGLMIPDFVRVRAPMKIRTPLK